MLPQGAVQHYQPTYCFSTTRPVPLLRTTSQLQLQVCFECEFDNARFFFDDQVLHVVRYFGDSVVYQAEAICKERLVTAVQ